VDSRCVLYITNQLPWPARSGGQVRESEILGRLSRNFEIHLAVLSHEPPPEWALSEISVETVDFVPPCPELGLKRGLPIRAAGYWSPSSRETIADLVRNYEPDLLHIEGSFLMPNVPSGVPTVLVDENIEHLSQRDREATIGRPSDEVERLYQLSISAWEAADICCVMSEQDAEVVFAANPHISIRILSNGADHLRSQLTRDGAATQMTGPPRMGYVGNFTWFPSLDAALWLVTDIWPKVTIHRSEVDLDLIGADPPLLLERAARRARRVRLVADPLDIAQPLAELDLMVAPLRIGSGVKIKVLEALSLGIPVLTTEMGARGLPDDVLSSACVVTDLNSFAPTLIELLREGTDLATLRTGAREAYDKLPTWDMAADDLSAVWREV